MMEKSLRIGIVGAGANTRERHIPGFLAIPGIELAVVANRSEESSRRVAEKFGIARIAPDWQAVVADPEVDAICIGTWPYLHAEITIAALAVGKHVLTEARMARNAIEAEQMLAASTQCPGLVAQIVPSPMTLRLDAMIRDLITTGQLGELREISVTHTTDAYADAAAPLTWRQDFNLSGHNTLTLGIYYEAVLRWMQEDVKVIAATAVIHTPERMAADGSKHVVKIPDRLTVLGSYGSGARLVMNLSGIERGQPRNEIRLHGSKASLRLEVSSGRLWHSANGQNERLIEVPFDPRHDWRVEADFVDSIQKKTPVRLTDFATGVRTMHFTDDVWRAWSAPAGG